MSETIELQGVVTTGLGEGARFLALDWVRDECCRKLGFTPCPGTFNLHMRGLRWARALQRMRSVAGVALTPATGFCAARCFPVRLGGQLAAIGILPEVAGYPPDKFELIAPVNLREALGLVDGDAVSIQVEIGGATATSPHRACPRT